MSLSIIPVSQVFGKYNHQTRMADLNRKNPIKTVQNQVDRVTISPEALKKRAIAVALSEIKNLSQESTEAKPVSIESIEPVSGENKIEQNSLKKTKELKKNKNEGLVAEAEGVRDKFLQKAKKIKEKAEAARKEHSEKQATPF